MLQQRLSPSACSSRLASSRLASASFSGAASGPRFGARRGSVRVSCAQWVDVHTGFRLLERSSFFVIDIRSFKEFDREHIVKPAKTCYSVPYQAGASKEAVLSELQKKIGPGRSRGLLIMSAEGGDSAAAVADMLESEGYETVRAVEGGYELWRESYTPSGRPTPPKGRWVSTGTEALKSGLNVGGVAESYEEKLNVEELTKKNLDRA